MNRRHGIVAALAVCASTLAACGGGGKGTAQQKTNRDDTSTSTEVTSTTAAAGQAGAPDSNLAATTTSVSSAATGSGSATATKTTVKSSTGPSRTTQATLTPIVNVTAAPTTTVAGGEQPRPGGNFTLLYLRDPTTLDPALMNFASSADGQPGFALFDDLAYNGGDSNVLPGTASSITSTDGVTWTIVVRPGIRFSDGTDYDAAAIKSLWSRIADPATKSPNLSLITAMKSYDVVDKLTIRVVLKEQNNQWPRLLSFALGYIPSPTAIQAKGNGFASSPVGAGPFAFRSWVRDDSLTLIRNADYWNKPYPFLDEVIFKPVSDENQRLNTFTTGAANGDMTTFPPTAANLRGAGYPEASIPLSGGASVTFNTAKAPFSDVRARRAVALGLDTNQFNKDVLNGVNPPIDTLFAKGSPFYDPSITLPAYDPQQAQQLLDAIAQDTGAPLTFTLGCHQTLRATCEWMQGHLSQYRNIKVTLDVQANTTAATRVASRSYDAFTWGATFVDPDPSLINNFLSTSSLNVSSYNDPAMDRALTASRNTFDTNARLAAIKDVQRLVAANVPNWFYQRSAVATFTSKNIRGLSSYYDGIVFWDRVWIAR